jgi:hypothetical protein
VGSNLFGPIGRSYIQGASLQRRLITCVLLLAPAAAMAEPMKLGAGDIKQTFTGSRIELDTPLGTTIPVEFTDDGLMSGNAGSLASVLGAAKDRGRWWVKDDRLCTKWFRWFDAEVQCLTIHMKDERVFWRRDDGKKGTATIVERTMVDAEPVKPLAPAHSRPAQRPAVVASMTAPRSTGARAPVLKRGPRLAVRPQSAAEQLGLADEAPADRSLFFVGLGLARALQSQFAITSAEAATVPPVARQAPVPAAPPPPVKKVITSAVAPKSLPAPQPAYPYPDRAAPPAITAATPAAVSFSVYGVATDDVLNMRSGPSEDFAIVGVIPPHASSVRLVGRCVDVWCEIQFRSQRGWVNRYYLAQN